MAIIRSSSPAQMAARNSIFELSFLSNILTGKHGGFLGREPSGMFDFDLSL